MAKEPQAPEPNPPATNVAPPEPVPQPPQPEGLTPTGAPIDERFSHLPPDQRLQKLGGSEEEEAAEQRRKSRSERAIGAEQGSDFHPSVAHQAPTQTGEALPEPPQTKTGEPEDEDEEPAKSSKKRR